VFPTTQTAKNNTNIISVKKPAKNDQRRYISGIRKIKDIKTF
jgi:hypothetical protein